MYEHQSQGGIIKSHRKTLGNDGYVHYLDGGDASTVYTYIKTYQIVHLKYMLFVVCMSIILQ